MSGLIKRCIILKILGEIKFLSLSSLAALLFISFNCFGLTSESVVINAPLPKTWKYIQDDKNASQWSVFFRLIEAAPEIEYPKNETLLFNEPDFVRRCYRNISKQGMFWDEETVEIKMSDESAYKKIRSFNFKGYGSEFNKMSMHVEQFYESLGEGKTKVTFVTKPYSFTDLQKIDSPISKWKYNLIRFIYRNFSEKRTAEIFFQNLQNIKYFIENPEGSVSAAPFQYKKFCSPEKQFWCLKRMIDY